MGIGFSGLGLCSYELKWISQSMLTTWNQLDPDTGASSAQQKHHWAKEFHSQSQAANYNSVMNWSTSCWRSGTFVLDNSFICLSSGLLIGIRQRRSLCSRTHLWSLLCVREMFCWCRMWRKLASNNEQTNVGSKIHTYSSYLKLTWRMSSDQFLHTTP